jgi:hypothetical protein
MNKTMRTGGTLKLWKRLLVAALGAHALAFIVPQKDDLVELSAFLNARSEAKFRQSDENIIQTLQPGTRAEVKETKLFESGNYGICLKVIGSTEKQNCTWVYYNGKNPNMNLYSVGGDPVKKRAQLARWNVHQLAPLQTTSPERATAAITIAPINGIQEAFKPVKSSTMGLAVDAHALFKSSLRNFSDIAKPFSQALVPQTECRDCVKENLTYAQCSDSNNYLENSLSLAIRDPDLAAVLQSPVRQIIRPACIQRSLYVFQNLKDGFKSCNQKSNSPNKSVEKACISKDYVAVTAKSFNAVADCLGDFASGSASSKIETSLEIFSLMAHESGLHANAVSTTGAGGVGQLTQDAITEVNQFLPSIISHLNKKSDPVCSQSLSNILKTPLSGKKSQSCERIELSKDNPLKNMLYSFAYQGINRISIESKIFDSKTFENVISSQLPDSERERLITSITAWSHNTGRGVMLVPLRSQMVNYLRNKKQVSNADDVDQFLKDMKSSMSKYSYYNDELNSKSTSESKKRKLRKRISETANYFQNIQSRMATIAQEPRSCLAN